jgi:hypothetical protein
MLYLLKTKEASEEKKSLKKSKNPFFNVEMKKKSFSRSKKNSK